MSLKRTSRFPDRADQRVAGVPVHRPSVQTSTRVVDDQTWVRAVVRTPWISPGDDLGALLRTHLAPMASPGDLAIVSEKAATIATYGGIPLDGVRVTPWALRLAEHVRPRGDSKGLSVPHKMQYVIDEVGRVRILAALAAAAVTRPLGVHGAFYVVAGRVARCMDGGRPPFEHLLLPPLHPRRARVLARSLATAVGLDVAIVDINDRGGSVRAVSGGPVAPRLLRRILADNPLGQRDQRTPIGLVTRAPRTVTLD